MDSLEVLRTLTDLGILTESTTSDYELIQKLIDDAGGLYSYTESFEFLCKQKGDIARDVGYEVLNFCLRKPK